MHEGYYAPTWPSLRESAASDYTVDSLQFKYDEALKKISRLEYEIEDLLIENQDLKKQRL